MSFTQHLSAGDIATLSQAALDSDAIDIDRAILLDHIHKGFKARLRKDPSPLTQFKLDLGAMNRAERLEDGSVPLVQFLRNIADHLRLTGDPEADLFARFANQIGNRVAGVPALPPPATLPEVVRNEAIVHQDDTVPFAFFSGGIGVGASVGHIAVPRYENGVLRTLANGSAWLMNGTAWVIGGGLVITNHHVINARESDEPAAEAADLALQVQGTSVEFDFDSDGSAVRTFGVSAVEIVDVALDYAILRLQQGDGRRPLRLHPQKVQYLPSTYLAVNIIQHPRGGAKRAAFRNNLVTAAEASTVRYFTDTDFGSSGAPVCDDNWRVIALHRGAVTVQNVNFQGKPSAYVNFGTQIQAVVADVQQRAPGVHAEIIAGQG